MNRNVIMQEVQAAFEQRRMQNKMEEQRRQQEIGMKHPDLADLLDRRQQLIYGSLRGMLAGKSTQGNLEQQMALMNQTIAKKLTECGYPADYLDPVCRCKWCRDTGYVGEPIREMCSCFKNEYYAKLYREVGLGDKADQCFEKFDLNVFPDKVPAEQQSRPGMPTQRKQMELIRDQCWEWATHYPDVQARDMVLSGKSGLGKTYLLHAMAKVLLDRGYNVLLISAYRFLELARKAYFDRQSSDMDDLMETDVLMLDDLGTEPLIENITVVQIFNLINERQLAGRATVLSTNLNKKELRERYTERVTSRLLDPKVCSFIPFYGDDIRRT